MKHHFSKQIVGPIFGRQDCNGQYRQDWYVRRANVRLYTTSVCGFIYIYDRAPRLYVHEECIFILIWLYVKFEFNG